MISALPTPPSRQDPTNFNDRADAFLGALPQFQTEANALQTNVNTSEVNAVNSAAAVLAATNIVKWVSGTTYANGAVVWSPINGLGYRRITASGSGTTDPSADATNYKQVNGTGDVSTTGNQTIAGVKTFSSGVVTNVTGNLTGNVTGNLTGTASNIASGVAVSNIGFTPVQQGTGIGQETNAVKIGWTTASRLKATVDATDIGYFLTGPSVPASSLSANGYEKLPSGLIIQWGSFSQTGSSTTVTLPITFPTAFVSVNQTLANASTSASGASIANTSQFVSIRDAAVANQVCYYVAIGY